MTENCSYESKFHSMQCIPSFISKHLSELPNSYPDALAREIRKIRTFIFTPVFTLYIRLCSLCFLRNFFIRVLCLHRAP